MHVRRRLLITFAFFTAVLTSVASRPAPSYAVGDIHAIVVISTTDPAIDQVPSGESILSYSAGSAPPLGFIDPARKNISRDDFTSIRVLEGQDADPRNIAKVCREVSQSAGADDAILVMVYARAALLPSGSGEERSVLFPLATSDDPNDRGVGLPRATILKYLNVKPHRLIALITDTYEGKEKPEPIPVDFGTLRKIRVPRPKETPYFVKFLQTARGELNYGTHFPLFDFDAAPDAPIPIEPSPSDASDSSPRFAPNVWTNGWYLDSELNPDDFYRLEDIEWHYITAGTLDNSPSRSDSGHPYGALRFNGDKPIRLDSVRFNTVEERDEFLAARREKLIDSGEFDGTKEITIGFMPENDDPFDDDDFVPAPDGRSPRSSSDDDDFIPAPGKRSPRSTSDDDFVPAPSASTSRQSSDYGVNANDSAKWSESSSRKAGTRQTLEIGGVEYGFCWIPAGEFDMGTPESEKFHHEDETLHHVKLTKGFWMLETEVTQALYQEVMGVNSMPEDMSEFKGDNLPAGSVFWNEVVEFCEAFTKLLPKGVKATPPTEAQWEYACRAGTQTAYSYGNTPDSSKMNVGSQTGSLLKPVKSYAPNPWGLYDMHGNVWEWCADRYGDYPIGTVTDPVGPNSGSERVVRGGDCNDDFGDFSRSASRRSQEWDGSSFLTLGFRFIIVCD